MPRASSTLLRPSARSVSDVFADAVARLDQQALATLFEQRPDLAVPLPADRADLLRRASAFGSVYRAVDQLDQPSLALVQAVVAWGGMAGPGELARLIGRAVSGGESGVGSAAGAADRAGVDRAVDRAASLLLLADADGTLYAHPTLAQIIPADQLGPPLRVLLQELTVDELRWVARHRPTGAAATRHGELVAALASTLADPHGIRAVVAGAPPGAATLARQLAHHSPYATTHRSAALYPRSATGRVAQPDDPVQWLAWHGLVVRDSWYQVVMPREVSLALHQGPVVDITGDRPALQPAGPPVPVADTDAAAAAAATELVSQVEMLVEAIAAAPTPLLKTGGVGVRQLRRLAKATGLAERRVAVLVEMAGAAGLLGRAGATWDGPGEVLPTAAFDTWCDEDPAARWLALVRTWLASERLPSAAGAEGPDGKARAALDGARSSEAPRHRQVVLRLLGELPAGTPAGRASLAEAAHWHAPLAFLAGPVPLEELVGWVLDEATALGLVHHDALSALGRSVVAGDLDVAATAFAGHTGPLASDLVLQADLTAVAPVAAPRTFRRRMELLADVESKGASVVYRFSDASVRRGFDAGMAADDILGFLSEHATTGVPQPLAYLVGDVARRHGSLRVGEVRSYVRGADEATVAELVRNRRTARLGLRAVAPTVLVSLAEPAAVVEALQAAGYLPGHEDAAGGLLVTRPDPRRATDAIPGPPAAPLLAPPAAAEAARRLVDGTAPVQPAAAARSSRAGSAPARPTTAARATGVGVAPPQPAAARSSRAGSAAPAAVPPLPPAVAAVARQLGMGSRDLADLACLVSGAPLGTATGPLDAGPSLDGVSGERLLAELLASALPQPSCDCRRPTAIARGTGSIGELLDDASAHDWTVRVAVTRRRQKPERSFFAEVEDLDEDAQAVTLWCHERDQQLVVPLASMAWARVLTEAEEHALFDGGHR